MELSELRVLFHFLMGISLSVCIALNPVTAPSSFLSTVSIHCSWYFIKDLGYVEEFGHQSAQHNQGNSFLGGSSCI